MALNKGYILTCFTYTCNFGSVIWTWYPLLWRFWLRRASVIFRERNTWLIYKPVVVIYCQSFPCSDILVPWFEETLQPSFLLVSTNKPNHYSRASAVHRVRVLILPRAFNYAQECKCEIKVVRHYVVDVWGFCKLCACAN